MARIESGGLLPSLVGLVLAASLPLSAADAPFVDEELADGVHLMQPRVPGPTRTNSLVVLQDEGPLVIDSQPTPESARELLSAIAAIDPRPVRFLILSHPHTESSGGAAAFPAGTVVVGSGGCRRLLEDPEYDPGAQCRAESPSPAEWVAPPRRLPSVVADGPLILADSKNPAEAYPIGVAHSEGDLLVHLPRSGILYAGALVVTNGNPFPGDGDLRGWLDALNQIASSDSKKIVPLRGAPTTAAEVYRFRDGLAWVRGQVETSLREGASWEAIPKFVVQSYRFAEYYDVNASPAFYPLLVEKVLREADEERTKRTLPSIAPH